MAVAKTSGDIITEPIWADYMSSFQISGGYVTRSGSNLLYAPAVGTRCLVYEATDEWVPKKIPDAGLTVACTGLTNSTAYYAYVYDSDAGGDLDTMILSTTAPTTQNGISVMTGFTARTLVARCYADASGNITTYAEDAATHLVNNVYNKRRVAVFKTDTTSSWTYATAAWRQARAQSTNRVQIVCDGVNHIAARVAASATVGATAQNAVTGVGIDSTSANSAQAITFTNGTLASPIISFYEGVPSAGYHAINWLEYTTGATATFYGQPSGVVSGIHVVFNA